jgi:hypothetical protein
MSISTYDLKQQLKKRLPPITSIHLDDENPNDVRIDFISEQQVMDLRLFEKLHLTNAL